MPDLDLRIREQLARYVAGEVRLPVFERSFSRLTAEVDESTPASLQDLVFDVELTLAEWSAGHRDEAEVRTRLLPYVQQYEVIHSDVPALARLRSLVLGDPRSADTPLQTEYL